MTPSRFREITDAYRRLKVVVAGDFCLDRYLHIDPALEETSIETGRPAHQVVQVRPQAGGAGNVLANVAALWPAAVRAVGVCGCDGEGYELLNVLGGLRADTAHFIQTRQRMTFTYTKPLVIRPGRPPLDAARGGPEPVEGPPEELSRLDIRDRVPMPAELAERIGQALAAAAAGADAVILMEQVPQAPFGVLSAPVKEVVARLAKQSPGCVFLADSRCDAGAFSGASLKVNRDELRRHFGAGAGESKPYDVPALAARWAAQIGRHVFVTLGGEGILAAAPTGEIARVAGIPVAPPIDVVGAGDTVLAHLAMALAAGASRAEAIELANLAGSIVVKKMGTTGTASVEELSAAMCG